MKAGKLFPLANRSARYADNSIMVQSIGEFRPPRRGEWYLSGAVVEGYLSPSRLDYAYHIARLVSVKVTTIYHVTGIVPVDSSHE